MSSLENQFIADGYVSLLHADGHALIDDVQNPIYDGAGNKSSLSLGRVNDGATITGALTAGGIRYPLNANVKKNDILIAESPTRITTISLSDLLALGQDDIPGFNGTGRYENPTIETVGGIITKITSNPRGGMRTVRSVGHTVIDFDNFDEDGDIKKVKFYLTAGGGGSKEFMGGGAGGTVIGYINLLQNRKLRVDIGAGGNTDNKNGRSSHISTTTGEILVSAYGGNTDEVITRHSSTGAFIDSVQYGGGGGQVFNDSLVPNYMIIQGGNGGINGGGNDAESPGGSSYWGGNGSYGGGQSFVAVDKVVGRSGSGVCVFEW